MNFGTYSFNVAWNPDGAATAYDALPGAPISCSIQRGRPSDLQGMTMGTCRLVLSDEARIYDPSNASSPLVSGGYLRPMRRLTVSITPAGSSGSYRQTVLNDNPSGYWRLGEAAGPIAFDASGYGHDAAYSGGVTLGQADPLASDPDTAALFDGATGQASVTYAAAPGTLVASVEAWVKILIGGSTGAIVQYTVGGAPDARYLLYHANNALIFRRSVGGAWTQISMSDAAYVGAWIHVVGTYDGATLRLYVNGALASTNASGGITLGGQETDPGLIRLAAPIDEVATYPTALSATRVAAHYNAGLNPSVGDAATTPIYTGYLSRLWAKPGAVEPTTEMEFVDGFWILQHAFPIVARTGQVTAGQALALLLNASGVTSEAHKALDQGGILPDFSADGTRSALDVAQEIEAVDQGVFYYSAAGRFTYAARDARYGRSRAAPVATISAASIATQVPGFDAAAVVNEQVVQVQRRVETENDDGSVSVSVADLGEPQVVSETSYLGTTQAGSPIASVFLRDETQAYSLAQHVVISKRTGSIPVQDVLVPGMSVAMVTAQATIELATAVTLSGLGVSSEALVESIRHEITRQQHATTYAVTPRPSYGFTIGYSTIGGADVLLY